MLDKGADINAVRFRSALGAAGIKKRKTDVLIKFSIFRVTLVRSICTLSFHHVVQRVGIAELNSEQGEEGQV